MKKRTLTCECGQDMLVPESALGRTGLCPACGNAIEITEQNTQPWEEVRPSAKRASGGLLALRDRHKVEVNNATREASWRKFAEAVDLYNSRRFAEALTLLNQLEEAFPGNLHIAEARDQCVEALEEGMAERKEYDGRPVQSNALNSDLVQALILDKMMRGATEEVQLQAAELAARMLGMLPQAASGGDTPSNPTLAPPPSPFLLGADQGEGRSDEVPPGQGASTHAGASRPEEGNASDRKPAGKKKKRAAGRSRRKKGGGGGQRRAR